MWRREETGHCGSNKKVIMCSERVFQTSVYPDCNQHRSPRKEYETQLHVILGSDFLTSPLLNGRGQMQVGYGGLYVISTCPHSVIT